jgi:hypothetical protein
MKSIDNYILEKFELNKNTKIDLKSYIIHNSTFIYNSAKSDLNNLLEKENMDLLIVDKSKDKILNFIYSNFKDTSGKFYIYKDDEEQNRISNKIQQAIAYYRKFTSEQLNNDDLWLSTLSQNNNQIGRLLMIKYKNKCSEIFIVPNSNNSKLIYWIIKL